MSSSNVRRLPAVWSIIASLCVLGGVSSCTFAGLTHRYSFSGTNEVKDSVGKVNGTLKNGATVADGKLTLKNEEKNSGDEDVAYVELAGPVLPSSGSVSLVIWFTAKDVAQFSRVLDIGDQDGGQGQAFVYFTPRNADDQSRGAITATDAGSKTAIDNDRLDDGKPHMVALVIDDKDKKVHVFIDGKEPTAAQGLGQNTLDAVHQKHNWIGRSAFDSDGGFTGSIEEFRVYDNALSADEAAAIFKAGPDALPPVAGATTAP